MVSIEFCHYLPDKAEKPCLFFNICKARGRKCARKELGGVPEKKRIFKVMQMKSFASLGLVTLGAVETLGQSKIPRRTLNMEPDLLLAVVFFSMNF